MKNPECLREQGFLGPELAVWVTECRKRFAPWFNLGDRVNALAMSTLLQLDAHNRVLHELLLASLYLRTLHNYEAAIVLAERGMVTQGRVMGRAMLDSLFPLAAIAKDHEFAFTYAHNHLLQQVKYFRKAKKLSTVRIPELDDAKNRARVEELKKEITEKGVKEITTKELADRAELADWYLTAYALLSGTIHARAGDLEEYLVLAPDGEIKEFDWGPRTKGIEKLLMLVIEAMLAAVDHVQVISPKHPTQRHKELRNELASLVKGYIPNGSSETRLPSG
jgi:hypothetical protein